MTSETEDLKQEVRRLMREERLSSVTVAERLGLSTSDVMTMLNGRNGSAYESQPLKGGRADGEQVQELRRLARSTLIQRVPELPPAPLVRLWQLVEDPKLLEGGLDREEDPFDVPEEVREKIFGLLDGI
jgi:hypothetical protein